MKNMVTGMWFGSVDNVKKALREIGADKDAKGNYILTGSNLPVSGIGGEEIMLSPDTKCFVDGKPVDLLPYLTGGTCVTVIM